MTLSRLTAQAFSESTSSQTLPARPLLNEEQATASHNALIASNLQKPLWEGTLTSFKVIGIATLIFSTTLAAGFYTLTSTLECPESIQFVSAVSGFTVGLIFGARTYVHLNKNSLAAIDALSDSVFIEYANKEGVKLVHDNLQHTYDKWVKSLHSQ